MGYWEQFGEENHAHRARRARMHPTRRALGDAFTLALVIAANLILWALLLAPFWLRALG